MTGLRGAVAAVGVGETRYYGRGRSPYEEQRLTLQAIVAACEDAGLDPSQIDGFASYGDDHNNGPSLVQALGTRELRWSSMVWGGGGGGALAAVGAAAAAIYADQASTVVVYRTICQAASGRLQDAVAHYGLGPHYTQHGISSPAQLCALRTQRLLHDGLPRAALEAFVRAEYFHAARNPRARAFELPLSAEAYARSRTIVEPLRLHDCSRENDVSVAVILTRADRARDLARPPVMLLTAAQGGTAGESLESDPDYVSGGFRAIAARLWRSSGLGPGDVDVAQIYDNFSGPAVAAMLDFGLFTIESAAETMRFENLIAPSGRLPINTSGGLIAEGNAHGMGIVAEAVRQLRGDSANPVAGAEVCLATGGPQCPLVSAALFGTPSTV